MGDRHESDEEGIWRRCRVRSRPDANADPDSEPESVGTKPDTESEPDANACDANSGAIDITESEPNTVDISGADSEHDAGTESVGNSVDGSESDADSVGDPPAQAGGDRHRRKCDRRSGRASDCRSRHLLDAPPPDDTPRRITNLSLRGVSLID